MGYRAQELFTQPFVSSARVVVPHNQDIEYPSVRLLVDNEIRPDLILGIAVDVDDPTNRLVVRLRSVQTGIVQITNFDNQPAGIQSATVLSLTGFGIKLVFGDEYTYVEDRPRATTTSDTFVQRLRLTTPSIPFGFYRAATSFLWDYSSTSNSISARLELDDTSTLWEMRKEPKQAGVSQRNYAAGITHTLIPAGIHTFDLDYRADVAAQTAGISEARIEFWRV